MSSQSGSEYNSRKAGNKSKKTKAQPILEKRTRRSNRKFDQGQQSQNVLPTNIPITDSQDLIIYHSFELETTKTIVQIPIMLFRQPKIQKQFWIRVGQTILLMQLQNTDTAELIVNAKIKVQHHLNNPVNGSKNTKQQQKGQKQQMDAQIQQISDDQSDLSEQLIYLIWGKACWIGAHEIISKTIKQTPKIINSEIFSQVIKIKTKDTNSDIFLIINAKKRVECVNDYNGLINQGNTCYMNSYLQMLSHISQFKNLVFEATLVDQNKFPATLQLLFHKLDNEQKPVSAEQLVKSFGWSKKQTNIQQDAQEFSCLFYDALERKLQEACPNPKHMSMSQMFQGKLRNLIQ